MKSSMRRLSPLDQWLSSVQHFIGEPEPSAADRENLNPKQRRHAAGLMRVNHAGEIAAQGLYLGQASLARNPATQTHMREAAAEEQQHLHWCAERLNELGSAPSLLAPLWYAGSYGIGAAAAVMGDKVSLGFVAETEAQVEAHLESHIKKLPAADERSRQIVKKMRDDEIKHGQAARDAGGVALPGPIRRLMQAAARVMTRTAYWV